MPGDLGSLRIPPGPRSALSGPAGPLPSRSFSTPTTRPVVVVGGFSLSLSPPPLASPGSFQTRLLLPGPRLGSGRGPGVGSGREDRGAHKARLTPDPPPTPCKAAWDQRSAGWINSPPLPFPAQLPPKGRPPPPKVHPRADDSAGPSPHPASVPTTARGGRGLGGLGSTHPRPNRALTAVLFAPVAAADQTAAAFSSTPMRLSAWCGD